MSSSVVFGMGMANSFDLRIVAQQFLELTGLTMAELARRGQVHRPNCLSWLAGKEQVFSEKKQLKVCEFLGWRYGRLRRDVVHHWQIGNDQTILKQVLIDYEANNSDTTLTIFQVKGQETEQAVIIVGVCRELPPLVILASRPLGYERPAPITATTLGYGWDSTHEHTISEAEWRDYWDTSSINSTAEEYLETYGRLLWEEVRHGVVKNNGMALSPHEVLQAYETDFNLEETMEWEATLCRAKNSGMGFPEILARVHEALNLDKEA